MIMVKYSAGSLMLWTYYFVGGPGHLVLIHGIMDCIMDCCKYQQIINQNLTATPLT